MTLREKFRMVPMIENGLSTLEKQEQIADEFAIEFAEWFHKNFQNQGIQIYTRFGRWEKVTIEEALEIFKKEKGL